MSTVIPLLLTVTCVGGILHDKLLPVLAGLLLA